MKFAKAKINPNDVVDALARLHREDQDYNDLAIVESWVASTIDYVARLEEVVQMYRIIADTHHMLNIKK